MNDATSSATGEVTGDPITVHVNGEPRTLRAETTLADLVPAEWKGGVAVACNDEIVPRAAWATTAVQAGDAIEIVRPVQGG